jgi:hypothetical protein
MERGLIHDIPFPITENLWVDFPKRAYGLLQTSVLAGPRPLNLPLFSTHAKYPDFGDEDTKQSTSGLGDLGVVFEKYGWKIPDIPTHSSKISSPNQSSDDSSEKEEESYDTNASSPPDDETEFLKNLLKKKKKKKNITWADDVLKARKPPPRGRNANRLIHHGIIETEELESRIQNLQTEIDLIVQPTETSQVHKDINFEKVLRGRKPTAIQEEIEPASVSKEKKEQPNIAPQTPIHLQSLALPSARHLLPASIVTPAIEELLYNPDASSSVVKHNIIAPILLLSREQKKIRLIEKLIRLGGDTSFLLAHNLYRSVHGYGGNVAPDGIHVFVDSSNIVINFQNVLKEARQLSEHALVKSVPFSFHSLALIMERGRAAAKRVLCGSSTRLDNPPQYMFAAERCGYEVSNLARVRKIKVEKDYSRRSRTGSGYGSGYGTGSGSEGPSALHHITEQGVDELLHLKMMESLMDYEPATIVLASGDAAEAEYSGGFLVMVERALKKGWKVELVAWKRGMSSKYKAKEFLSKWQSQFSIFYLDDFSEELLSLYTVKHQH